MIVTTTTPAPILGTVQIMILVLVLVLVLISGSHQVLILVGGTGTENWFSPGTGAQSFLAVHPQSENLLRGSKPCLSLILVEEIISDEWGESDVR